uniref:Uncharacterized protein n=1 Tax=Oryza brachyantha TaxID=4533 RepID=J3MX79_ORYBR
MTCQSCHVIVSDVVRQFRHATDNDMAKPFRHVNVGDVAPKAQFRSNKNSIWALICPMRTISVVKD